MHLVLLYKRGLRSTSSITYGLGEWPDLLLSSLVVNIPKLAVEIADRFHQ